MAKLSACKSTLIVALMLSTVGIGTSFAQNPIAPIVRAPQDAGGGAPAPPDPGPSPNLALHLI